MLAALCAGFAVEPATLAGAQTTKHPPPFEAEVKGPAPDYSRSEAWAALPDKLDAADDAPAGDAYPDAQAAAPVDVFYIHPTTFDIPDNWNQVLDDAKTNDWTDISVVARQASIFNNCCKVYAPRYRQASGAAFYAAEGDGGKAYRFAYADVLMAFDYYIQHYNHGRPFILAGHSQGAQAIYWLVADRIDGTPLQSRFIAAYAPGFPFSLGDFGHKYRSVQPCRKPDQLACVASWNSFVRTGDPSGYITASEARYVKQYGAEGKSLLCVNPLTFDMDRPSAPASANLGALPGAAAHGPLPAVIPGAAGADCVGGVLMTDQPTDPAFKLNILPHGLFHYHDMDTFYQNIRVNAALRVKAYFAAH
jgi:hypothetical protein